MSKGNVEMQGPSKSLQLGEICLGDVAIIGGYWGNTCKRCFFWQELIFSILMEYWVSIYGIHCFWTTIWRFLYIQLRTVTQTFLGNACYCAPTHTGWFGDPQIPRVYHHIPFLYYNGNLGVSPCVRQSHFLAVCSWESLLRWMWEEWCIDLKEVTLHASWIRGKPPRRTTLRPILFRLKFRHV
jgi:hypothetical protein